MDNKEDQDRAITVAEQPDGANDEEGPPSSGEDRAPETGNWTIYLVERISDGKPYVGITMLPVAQRFKAHEYNAVRARRPRRRRLAETLGDAVRACRARGKRMCMEFRLSILDQATTGAMAQKLEREWIARLDTASPGGFNSMPGGSLGGPSNSRPTTISHPVDGRVTFSSLGAAIRHRRAELAIQGGADIGPAAIYARLASGWSVEEALGYVERVDRRTTRSEFKCAGKSFISLRTASEALGTPVSTLRSRLHRAASAGVGTSDLAGDRRRRSLSQRAPRQRPTRLELPDPRTPGAFVSPSTFSQITGVPESTVVHRWHRFHQKFRSTEMESAALIRWLTTTEDRRHHIHLRLLDGTTLTGGIREVIRAFFEHPQPDLTGQPLSESAIRRRLRLVMPTTDHSRLRWAFGLVAHLPPSAARPGARRRCD